MEVAMKKLILTLSLLLCAITSPILSMVIHAPAPGGIQLGGLPSFDPNGTIMKTILHDPNFEEERNAIKTFLQSTTINQNYQAIISAINNAPANMPGALESLEAFERAIMNYIHSENYIFTIENKWLNVFVTGVRWNWINPKCWIQPSYWFSDNSRILEQCMQELSTISNIAKKYSIITSARMKATVESYLHWRRNIAILITAYFAGNLMHHGWKKSSLKMLKNGGLENLEKVAIQGSKDIANFTGYSLNAVYNGVNSLTKWIQPLTKFILHGDQTPDKKITSPDSSRLNSLFSSGDTKNTSNSFYSKWKDYNKSLKDKFYDEKETKEQ
jgi:hypothetical protein